MLCLHIVQVWRALLLHGGADYRSKTSEGLDIAAAEDPHGSAGDCNKTAERLNLAIAKEAWVDGVSGGASKRIHGWADLPLWSAPVPRTHLLEASYGLVLSRLAPCWPVNGAGTPPPPERHRSGNRSLGTLTVRSFFPDNVKCRRYCECAPLKMPAVSL